MNNAVREIATSEAFWKALGGFFAEENHADSATQDNISCIKSICKANGSVDFYDIDFHVH